MTGQEINARLEAATSALDNLCVTADQVYDLMDEVEAEWDAHFDTIAEELKDQMVEDGRKGDPAEHYVTSVARRRRPELYSAYRKARRAIERFKVESKNRQSELTGYQSLLKSEVTLASDTRGLPQHAQRRNEGWV